MTLPDPTLAHKPRRLGLYAPFVALIVAVAAWSVYWLWLESQIIGRMDAARDRLNEAGWTVTWGARAVSGYPFRLDVDLTDARLREPSGWALATPRLKSEAFAFSPSHWVMSAPAGAVFTRPLGGPVAVRAKVLRASFSRFAEHPPRLSVEGQDLSFEAPPGANPFFVSAAREFHFHTKAGPGDQGAVYLELDGATARLAGLFGRIAQGRPVNLTADAIVSHAHALSGPDWPAAVRSWTAAGGALELRRLHVAAGEAFLDTRAGVLTVGPDGRLRGALTTQLRQAPRALTVMGQDGAIAPGAAAMAADVVAARSSGPLASVTLDFEAGQTTVGPVAVARAPRVY